MVEIAMGFAVNYQFVIILVLQLEMKRGRYLFVFEKRYRP